MNERGRSEGFRFLAQGVMALYNDRHTDDYHYTWLLIVNRLSAAAMTFYPDAISTKVHTWIVSLLLVVCLLRLDPQTKRVSPVHELIPSNSTL